MKIRLFWKLINYVASQDERRIDRYGVPIAAYGGSALDDIQALVGPALVNKL